MGSEIEDPPQNELHSRVQRRQRSTMWNTTQMCPFIKKQNKPHIAIYKNIAGVQLWTKKQKMSEISAGQVVSAGKEVKLVVHRQTEKQ